MGPEVVGEAERSPNREEKRSCSGGRLPKNRMRARKWVCILLSEANEPKEEPLCGAACQPQKAAKLRHKGCHVLLEEGGGGGLLLGLVSTFCQQPRTAPRAPGEQCGLELLQ